MATILKTPTNLLTITEDNVYADEIHKFSAFASDLGLKPGQVPGILSTTLGNGQPLLLQRCDEGAAKYRQSMGCITVTIYND